MEEVAAVADVTEVVEEVPEVEVAHSDKMVELIRAKLEKEIDNTLTKLKDAEEAEA